MSVQYRIASLFIAFINCVLAISTSEKLFHLCNYRHSYFKTTQNYTILNTKLVRTKNLDHANWKLRSSRIYGKLLEESITVIPVNVFNY
jgi:hypothetical protein